MNRPSNRLPSAAWFTIGGICGAVLLVDAFGLAVLLGVVRLP